MRQIGQGKRQSGFTLIEACIAVTVLAVLAGTAIPSFKTMLQRRHLEGHALQYAQDVQHARSQAVLLNRTVRLSFGSSSQGSCYVIHTGAAGDCVCSGPQPAACTANAQAFQTTFVAATSGVRLQPNVASMVFDPLRGMAATGSTLRVIADDGTEVRQIVNIMGRVRACSPAGSVKGFPRC